MTKPRKQQKKLSPTVPTTVSPIDSIQSHATECFQSGILQTSPDTIDMYSAIHTVHSTTVFKSLVHIVMTLQLSQGQTQRPCSIKSQWSF